jgi:hypothetical protein
MAHRKTRRDMNEKKQKQSAERLRRKNADS